LIVDINNITNTAEPLNVSLIKDSDHLAS